MNSTLQRGAETRRNGVFPLNAPLRIEARGVSGSVKLAGHAAVFGQISTDLGGFREKIAPGAFRRTIRTADVVALWNHNADHPLGRTSARTLTLSEDSIGLAFELTLPDTTVGRDLAALVRDGIVSEMSFGFETVSDSWGSMTDPATGRSTQLRTLNDVDLWDVSPVTYPAYPGTDVGLRSFRSIVYGDRRTSVRNGSGSQGSSGNSLALRRRELALMELECGPAIVRPGRSLADRRRELARLAAD